MNKESWNELKTWTARLIRLIDRPQVVNRLPFEALPPCCNETGLGREPDNRMDNAFRAALNDGYKWVEAVPDGDEIKIVGHRSRINRDKSDNWQLGKPVS